MAARFLISRLSSLGDVVCSLPAAGALKAGFSDCHIVWAVDRRFSAIVKCCRFADEVLEVSPGLSPSSWPRIPGRFDAALDLQGLFKSAIIVARAKADRKLGYHWQREGASLFSGRVVPDPTSIHIVDQYVDVARAAGGVSDFADFALSPQDDAMDSIRHLVPFTDFVVLNPGAAWASKRWPASHFAQLANSLGSEGLTSVLIGGKAESDLQSAEAVQRLAPNDTLNICGQTSIFQLVALLSLAKAHVGGDTGSTHIAAALGIPAIGLYSITNPKRSCPYGQIERCHYEPQGLEHIDPEAVSCSVLEALN